MTMKTNFKNPLLGFFSTPLLLLAVIVIFSKPYDFSGDVKLAPLNMTQYEATKCDKSNAKPEAAHDSMKSSVSTKPQLNLRRMKKSSLMLKGITFIIGIMGIAYFLVRCIRSMKPHMMRNSARRLMNEESDCNPEGVESDTYMRDDYFAQRQSGQNLNAVGGAAERLQSEAGQHRETAGRFPNAGTSSQDVPYGPTATSGGFPYEEEITGNYGLDLRIPRQRGATGGNPFTQETSVQRNPNEGIPYTQEAVGPRGATGGNPFGQDIYGQRGATGGNPFTQGIHGQMDPNEGIPYTQETPVQRGATGGNPFGQDIHGQMGAMSVASPEQAQYRPTAARAYNEKELYAGGEAFLQIPSRETFNDSVSELKRLTFTVFNVGRKTLREMSAKYVRSNLDERIQNWGERVQKKCEKLADDISDYGDIISDYQVNVDYQKKKKFIKETIEPYIATGNPVLAQFSSRNLQRVLLHISTAIGPQLEEMADKEMNPQMRGFLRYTANSMAPKLAMMAEDVALFDVHKQHHFDSAKYRDLIDDIRQMNPNSRPELLETVMTIHDLIIPRLERVNNAISPSFGKVVSGLGALSLPDFANGEVPGLDWV